MINNNGNDGIYKAMMTNLNLMANTYKTPKLLGGNGNASVRNVSVSNNVNNIETPGTLTIISPEAKAAQEAADLAWKNMSTEDKYNYYRQEAYDRLPENEKYHGDLTQAEITEKFFRNGEITMQEHNFMNKSSGVKSGGTGQYVEAMNLLKETSNKLNSFLKKNGIELKDNEKLNIKVDAYYNATVTGIEDTEKLDKINQLLNSEESFELKIKLGSNALMPGLSVRETNSGNDYFRRQFQQAQIRLRDYFPTEKLDLQNLSLSEDGKILGLSEYADKRLNSLTDTGKYATNGDGWDWSDPNAAMGQLKNNIISALTYLKNHDGKPPTSGDAHFTFGAVPKNPDAKVQVDGFGLITAYSDFTELKDPYNYDRRTGEKVSNFPIFY